MRDDWWDRRWVLILIAAASAIPLLWPEIPPLVDVPGHMGRYRVQMDLASSPTLRAFFDFHWALIGNLGVDLLIVPLEPVLGLELSVKLVVMTIPALTVAGIFWVASEVHGRVPPSAFFAIPFVYGFPFNFGFINYCLSVALALLAFTLWLRLRRRTRLLRIAVFVPLAMIIWTAHAFGWFLLGLFIWSSELVSEREKRSSWMEAALAATVQALPLAPPLILMLVWRSGDASGTTAAFFGLGLKFLALISALRDRWLLWDTFSVAIAAVLIGSALFDKHLLLSRRLAAPAAVLALIFVLMPRLVFGSNYADMRLAPLIFILFILAARPAESMRPNARQWLAISGLAFAALRIGGNSLSYWIADREAQRQLVALDHVAQGARVLVLVGDDCGAKWKMPRNSHLASMVVVRKHGFSNDQWQLPGSQLLRVTYTAAQPFMANPSEGTVTQTCRTEAISRAVKADNQQLLRYIESTHRTADQSLDRFPRPAFDYVWLIRPLGFTSRPRDDLRLIWRGSGSSLYEIVRNGAGATPLPRAASEDAT